MLAADAWEAVGLCAEVWLWPLEEADGAAGAAPPLPPAGAFGGAGLAPVDELEVEAAPVPPSIVKGPAKARSGEFPSSKASRNNN